MDDGGGNGGGSFKLKVEHGPDAAEVTDVHKAGAGEVGDVVGDRPHSAPDHRPLRSSN